MANPSRKRRDLIEGRPARRSLSEVLTATGAFAAEQTAAQECERCVKS